MRIPCRVLFAFLLAALWGGHPEPSSAEEAPSPAPLILAHYMPWFEAKPFHEKWGWHWTMNAFKPDEEKDGKRPIAAHQYPLLGPYDSADPAVLEYHLLLMRLSGIDGVIVDWYGLSDHGDYPMLHRNTMLLQQAASALGMKFAICYEDQTVGYLIKSGKVAASERATYVNGEIKWVVENWGSQPNYVRFQSRPLVLSFGFSGLTDAEWAEALRTLPQPVAYDSEHFRRPCASGAFDWPKPEEHPRSMDDFYGRLAELHPAIPVAFPRFQDIQHKAGLPGGHKIIEDRDGHTWKESLRRALASKAPIVQLATWNDWGEGTEIEPSREFGYRDLEVVQRARREHVEPAFAGKPGDLRLPERLFQLRKANHEESAKRRLDEVAGFLAKGTVGEATAILDRMESESGKNSRTP